MMSIRRSLIAFCLVATASLIWAGSAHAQLAPFGASGVVMGHVHLNVTDIDAHKKFWAQLGGVPVTNGTLQMIQFRGTFINLRQQVPTAGTVGSTVNHFGFLV